MILNGTNNNIRKVLKTGHEREIGVIKANVYGAIIYLANVYTGANFTKNKPNEPLMTKDLSDILDACQELVINQFPMLALEELKLAFEMASAGKFEGLNIETYYGKFSVHTLGKILKAYLAYRTSIAAKYSYSLELIEARKEDALKQQKNEDAKQEIIKEFNQLKETYMNDLEIDESKIQAFWGKILVDAGLIKFTTEEKATIYEEAKEITKVEISNAIASIGKHTPAEKTSLRAILEKANTDNGLSELPIDFKRKATANYSKLLIKKAIINHD